LNTSGKRRETREGEGTGNHLNERRGSRVEWAPGGRAGTGVTGARLLSQVREAGA
jgi:hypothetical protein